MLPPSYSKLPALYWDKVTPAENGCWVWNAATAKGYGRFLHEGRLQYAHRLSFADAKGDIPLDLLVTHSCDVPLCVYPAHLSTGTSQDNADDMVCRGRSAKGESHWSAKLTDSDVKAIRQRYAAGGAVQQFLADEYGVTHQAISLIITRKKWRHI